MDRLFESLETSHYLNLMMYATSFAGIIVSVKKRKRFPLLKFFPLYFIFSFIQSIASELDFSINYGTDTTATYVSINLFICFEYLIIANFFYKLNFSRSIQKIILLTLVGFYSFMLVMWATRNELFEDPRDLYIVEALFVIPLPLTYFYYLFKEPPIKELTNDPTFWISTAILFYFTTTLPLFLIYHKFTWEIHNLLYPINYVAYSILFLLIIRAFLCKPELQK